MANPRHRAPVRPPTPQHARSLALPAELHGLPPQQGDPWKDGGLGPGCPERDRGRWLTNEPDGCISQAGLSILQVRQALLQVFLSSAPVPRQLQRARGHGHVAEPLRPPEPALLQHPLLQRPGGQPLSGLGPGAWGLSSPSTR